MLCGLGAEIGELMCSQDRIGGSALRRSVAYLLYRPTSRC